MRAVKNAIKNIFVAALASLARSIILTYNPRVVMITGSVGKTSTKDAVAAALSERFNVRKSEKSLNSEYGVPLTIIGVKNPWTNPFAWLGVFLHALSLVYFKREYPELLVLEVGADRPGDLAKVLRYVTPDAVVVTLLPAVPVHVEAYATPAAVRDEEFAPARALAEGAQLIFSADDEFASSYAQQLPHITCTTFGYTDDANISIGDVGVWSEDGKAIGMQAMLHMRSDMEILNDVHGTSGEDSHKVPLHVRGAFGRSQLYAPAAAIAAAHALGVTTKEAFEGLQKYVPPPGRGRIFEGIKDTILLDDTYNSSPAATIEALGSLDLISPVRRRVAILGDMLELGSYSDAEHEHIGHIAKQHASVIVSVGPKARGIVDAARRDGMPEESLYSFDTATEAVNAIPDILQEGDIVLVKASQSIRLERVMRVLLAKKSDLTHLVRQEKEWQKR